jgi:hypothetical protein
MGRIIIYLFHLSSSLRHLMRPIILRLLHLSPPRRFWNLVNESSKIKTTYLDLLPKLIAM